MSTAKPGVELAGITVVQHGEKYANDADSFADRRKRLQRMTNSGASTPRSHSSELHEIFDDLCTKNFLDGKDVCCAVPTRVQILGALHCTLRTMKLSMHVHTPAMQPTRGRAGRESVLLPSQFLDGKLQVDADPFNVFARVAAGKLKQKEQFGWLGTEAENTKLGEYSKLFVVCCNREENDLAYLSEEQQWKGRASMGKHHRFLTVKNLSWWMYNVAVPSSSFLLLPCCACAAHS